jgi:hypothetical protein
LRRFGRQRCHCRTDLLLYETSALQDLFDQAIVLHRQGRLSQAERLYQLALGPDYESRRIHVTNSMAAGAVESRFLSQNVCSGCFGRAGCRAGDIPYKDHIGFFAFLACAVRSKDRQIESNCSMLLRNMIK